MSRFAKKEAAAGSGEQGAEIPRSNLCVACKDQPGKYKCPRCIRLYCSVACNKIHQQNHPPDTEPPKTAEPSHVYVPLEDAKPDPTNKYSFLDNSEEMKKLCAKYPHLPELLMKIGDAAEPDQPAPGQGFMKQGPRPDDATWRRDQGKTRGRAALNRAMMAPGSNGDAIREYHEVVLHFLAKKNGA